MSRVEHSYFFLSYAEAGQMSEGVAPEPDLSVSGFFRDLCEAVSSRASRTGSMAVGFFDQEIPPDADRAKALEQALSTAEVFVALYSPRYFNRSAPLRELRMFQHRLERSRASDRPCHIVPVLWTPLAPDKKYPDIQRARALGEDSRDYLDNGMRALRKLTLLRDSYEKITERIARQIVDCAELHTIGPSMAVPPDSATQIDDSEVQLAIGVLAPEPAWEWRPFAQRSDLSIRYAANTADRLNTATRVGDLAQVRGLFADRPCLLFIDPSLVATDDDKQLLTTAFAGLPKWVVPIVITDNPPERHDPDVALAAAEVVTLLQNMGLPSGQPVTKVEEFLDMMPQAITKARRRFLDLFTMKTGSTRPSLRGPATEANGI